MWFLLAFCKLLYLFNTVQHNMEIVAGKLNDYLSNALDFIILTELDVVTFRKV